LAVVLGSKESTSTKLCHMTGHKLGMITYVQFFFGGGTPKIWKSQKFESSARFRTPLTANILGTVRNIKNWKQTDQHLSVGFRKKLVNFGPPARIVTMLSTMRVLRMLMLWSSSLVTLLRGNFTT